MENTVFYLGSSVTRGEGGDTDGVSFAETIAQKTGWAYCKEAVSGTTLVQRDTGDKSYVSRLARLDFSVKPRALVVQLSTNDFAQGVPIGGCSGCTREEECDVSQTAGAIEYIIAYVRKRSPETKIVVFTCPLTTAVPFYAQYAAFVRGTLQELAARHGVLVADLFSLPVTKGCLQLDGLHPTRLGYEKLFVAAMLNALKNL